MQKSGKSRLIISSIILCLFFLSIIITSNIIRAEGTNYKSYNPITSTVSVYSSDNVTLLGQVQLLTPHDYHVPAGEQLVAEFKITNTQDSDLLYQQMKFYNVKNGSAINRTFEFKYKENVSVVVDDYGLVNVSLGKYSKTNISTISQNGNLSNSTNFTNYYSSSDVLLCQKDMTTNQLIGCDYITADKSVWKLEMGVVGSHSELQEQWKLFDKLKNKTSITAGTYTVGIFTNVLVDDKVEWIPTFFGVDMEEFAQWTYDINVGLVSYYNFNESSGNLIDLVGDYDMTLAGTVAQKPGVVQKSRGDYADANYFTIQPSGVVIGTANTWAVSMWFNTSYNSAENRHMFTSHPDTLGGWGNDFELYIDINSSEYLVVSTIFRGCTASVGWQQAGLVDGNWHNVIASHNATDASVQIYVDGEFKINSGGGSCAGYTSPQIEIGKIVDDGTSQYSTGIDIDELGIWSRGLTAEEANLTYQSGLSGNGYQVVPAKWTSSAAIITDLSAPSAGYGSLTIFNTSNGLRHALTTTNTNSATPVGLTWDGDSWVANTTMKTGLSNSDWVSKPDAFWIGSNLYLIIGGDGGTFQGYKWNGSGWDSNSTIVLGLGDVGGRAGGTFLNVGGTYYLIAGNGDGDFDGFVWNGSGWNSNTTIITGLPDIGAQSKPTSFFTNNTNYLMAGRATGDFLTYSWNGTSWNLDNSMDDGLADIGADSTPTVFEWNGNYSMITGAGEDFSWYGYTSNIPYQTYTNPNTAPSIIANATLPSTVYTNTDYLVNLTAIDAEQGYINGWVQFYKNDAPIETDYANMTNNTNTLVGSFANTQFVKGDNLTAEVWVGDGTVNTTKVNLTGITVSNSVPVVTFLSQTPADMNFSNIVSNPAYLNYSITDADSDLNLSQITFYYKTNTSTSNVHYIQNGTAQSGFFPDTDSTNISSNYSWKLGDNSIHRGIFNIGVVTIDNLTHLNSSTTTANNYYLTEYLNISNTSSGGYFEIMAKSTAAASPANLYYCNSTYVSGNIVINPNCVLAATKTATTSYNHCHLNSSCHFAMTFAINTTTGKIGNVTVTPTSYFAFGGATNWNVSYVANTIRTGMTKTTANRGTTWTNQTYTIDQHVHQFDIGNANETFYYYACANDTSGASTCSSVNFDLLETTLLSPSAPTVLTPTNTSYSGNITITYTQAVSPQGSAIFYNISLLNTDYTFNKTIISNNSDSLSYVFDTSTTLDGSYIIRVLANDTDGKTSNGYSENFTIGNTARLFISTWDTTLVNGGSDSYSIILPLDASGTYNFFVDWGDNSNATITTSTATHTYSSEGIYTIKINGVIIGWRSGNTGDELKLLNITQWGDLRLGNTGFYFSGDYNLNLSGVTDILNLTGTTTFESAFENTGITTINNSELWDTSQITSMTYAFGAASDFNANISTWNVSEVTDMSSMFNQATSFNQDLSNWNTGKVTTMTEMFAEASAFNGNISTWYVNLLEDMSYMFYKADSFNQPLNDWDTSSVTTLEGTFNYATNFNQDLDQWDTSSVTSISDTFKYATNFNGNVSTWDITSLSWFGLMSSFEQATNFNGDINNWQINNGAITSTGWMFSGATSFNQPLDKWNMSKITDTSHMFDGTTSFNQNISGWDLSKTTDMSYMFQNAISFNQNISGWDTSSSTQMQNMFYNTSSFDQDLGSWDVSQVTLMTDMFGTITLSTDNYNSILNGWSTLPSLQSGVDFSAGNSQYSCLAVSGKTILTDTYSWTISDGGLNESCNTDPLIIANSTAPTLVYTNTDFLVNLTALDNESLFINGWVSFYVNGVFIETDYVNISNNTNSIVGNLSNTQFVHFDNITSEIWVGDGTVNISKVNLTNVMVLNSLPVITTLQTIATINSSSTYLYDYNATDIDSDTLSWIDNTTLFNIDSSTGIITDSPTDSEYGNYSILITVNDGYSGTNTDEFIYEILDTTNPNVTFVSQTPSDINSSNLENTKLYLNYSITDGYGINTSSVTVWYKVNNSNYDGHNFVNGSIYKTGYIPASSSLSSVILSNDSSNWTFAFEVSSVYPAVYNLRQSSVEKTTHNSVTLTGNDDYVKIEFLNVSDNLPYNLFEVMANTSGTGDLRVYYCNSTFSTGTEVINSNNCYLFNSIHASSSYSHSHTYGNSAHQIVPMAINTTTGKVGTVKITNTSYILLRGIKNTNWNIYNVANTTRTNAIQTSTDKGKTWTGRTYTVDAHIHQFNGDTFWYFVSAKDIVGNEYNSSFRSDTIEKSPVAPTAPGILYPIENNYSNNIIISYTESVSLTGNALTYYNISLLNSDSTFNKTIIGNNGLNLAYTWNTHTVVDGIYKINVEICDNTSLCSHGVSEEFIVDNSAPILTIIFPNNLDVASLTMGIQVNTNELATCKYQINGGINQTLTSVLALTHAKDISSGSNGVYTIVYYCVDNLGNEGNASKTYSVLYSPGNAGGGGGGGGEVVVTDNLLTSLSIEATNVVSGTQSFLDTSARTVWRYDTKNKLIVYAYDDNNQSVDLTSIKISFPNTLSYTSDFARIDKGVYSGYITIKDNNLTKMDLVITAVQNDKTIVETRTIELIKKGFTINLSNIKENLGINAGRFGDILIYLLILGVFILVVFLIFYIKKK